MKECIKYSKAIKLPNFGLPKECPGCGKDTEPRIHCETYREGFFTVRMASLYEEQCMFCGEKYKYYA